MIDVTHFTEPELLKLKELTEYSRTALFNLCTRNKKCTGCQWRNLCNYYRDIIIVADKELKRRAY